MAERIQGPMTRKERKSKDASEKALANAVRMEEKARKASEAKEAKRKRDEERATKAQGKRQKITEVAANKENQLP